MSLFRNIAVPDQKKLAEGDVGPEKDKAEHVFAQIMVMFDRHFILYRSTPLEGVNSDRDDAMSRENAPCKNIDPEHG